MIEQAREELQKLDALYPNRFDSLKLQLKSFISLLESNSGDPLRHAADDPVSLPPSSTATTQGSTCRKRTKKKKEVLEDNEDMAVKKKKGRSDRVEAVLQRAHLCLRKIQQLKSSF